MNLDGDGLFNTIESQLDRDLILFVQLNVFETIRVNSHVQLRVKDGRGVTISECECTTTFRCWRVGCRGFFRGLQNDGRTIGIEDDTCKVHNGAVRTTVVWVRDDTGEKDMRTNDDWDLLFDVGFCREWVGTLTFNNVPRLEFRDKRRI